MSKATDIADFKKVLVKYGFKRIDLGHISRDMPYGNEAKGIFAEILDRGRWVDLWAIGGGLKSSDGFPGGYMYSDANEFEGELLKIFNK